MVVYKLNTDFSLNRDSTLRDLTSTRPLLQVLYHIITHMSFSHIPEIII